MAKIINWLMRMWEEERNNPKSGQPQVPITDVNITRVPDTIQELQINPKIIRPILTVGLGLRKMSAKFLPRILTVKQKLCKLDMATDLSSKFAPASENYYRWCIQYDPETKNQNMQWKSSDSPGPNESQRNNPQKMCATVTNRQSAMQLKGTVKIMRFC